MPEVSRPQLALYAVVLCTMVWFATRYLGREGGDAPVPVAAAPELSVRREGAGRVTVHVAGAVRRPGVYRLRDGTRVDAAVDLAGGATARADLDGLNLAAKIQDGRQIVVPVRVKGGGPAVATGAATAGVAGAPGQPIDLNRASLEQLDTLDGVGPAIAQKILAYREEKGGFGSVEELGQVPGIGAKRLAALREKVRV